MSSEATGTAVFPARKKIKLSQFIDQGDDSEVHVADNKQVRIWQARWQNFAMGPPLDDEAPTVEQLTGLHVRVEIHKRSPYADFAVWTPYSRKTTRANKFTAYMPQPDGTWLAK